MERMLMTGVAMSPGTLICHFIATDESKDTLERSRNKKKKKRAAPVRNRVQVSAERGRTF